jgi:hypothetical protein
MADVFVHRFRPTCVERASGNPCERPSARCSDAISYASQIGRLLKAGCHLKLPLLSKNASKSHSRKETVFPEIKLCAVFRSDGTLGCGAVSNAGIA